MKNFPSHEDNPNIDDEYFNIIHLKNLNRSNFDNYYSEKCCNYVKGGLKNIKLPTFVGTMASESELRKRSWIQEGCNIINAKRQISRPLSIWNEKDIWKYILKNNIEINRMYGYDKKYVDDPDNKNQIDNLINNLKYKRLGCTSCPYGAHLEKDQNRFEILYEESKLLYESQVIKNGMYKVLIDMDIKIKNDEKYMILYHERRKQINNWIDNLDENIFKIISQIENYQNYKNYKPLKNKNVSWEYTIDEISEILYKYKIYKKNNQLFTKKEIKNKINKYRKLNLKK